MRPFVVRLCLPPSAVLCLHSPPCPMHVSALATRHFSLLLKHTIFYGYMSLLILVLLPLMPFLRFLTYWVSIHPIKFHSYIISLVKSLVISLVNVSCFHFCGVHILFLLFLFFHCYFVCSYFSLCLSFS